MIAERTIQICGHDVQMRYCTAAETGYEKLTGKSSAIFMPIFDKDKEGNVKNVMIQATTEDYITLGMSAIVAAYAKNEQEPPIKADDILYDATPKDVNNLINTVIELRNKWYEVPEVVKTEDQQTEEEREVTAKEEKN